MLAAAAIVVGVVRPGAGPSTVPAPRARPAPPPTPLAIGITEANPHLIAPGPQPPAFAPWRDALLALHPRYLRVLIDWRRVQPTAAAPPDWTQPADGCLRGIPPCAPYSGIQDLLLAAKAAGMQPVIVILDTPDWAASPPSPGCQVDQDGTRARMPADLDAYRALIRSLLEEGRRIGVDLPWWSAWNEPNHPAFLGPQRAACSADAPSLAASEYVPLVHALQAELAAWPGDQSLLIGETAGYRNPNARGTGAAELAAALPDDVVCSAAAWVQHAYVKASGPYAAEPAGADLLAGVESALDAHGCPGGPLPLWIGETGVAPSAGEAGCEQMAAALHEWAVDPRVDAAFQYTFREDTAFRTGLADEGLTQLRPSYQAWAAYARGGVAAVADPAAACA